MMWLVLACGFSRTEVLSEASLSDNKRVHFGRAPSLELKGQTCQFSL